MSRNQFRTPLKQAMGLGSAKYGVAHFIAQRVTAVAIGLAVLYSIFVLFGAVGQDYDGVRALVAQPVNAAVLIALVVAACWHASLGVQVIIEDYIHAPAGAVVALLLTRFVCAFAAIVGVLAIVRIALGN